MRIKKNIIWPLFTERMDEDFKKAIGHIYRFISQLRKIMLDRDKEIALAINSASVEVVDSEPTSEPDYGEPNFKLYKSGATWRLYAYTGETDGWVYFNSDG